LTENTEKGQTTSYSLSVRDDMECRYCNAVCPGTYVHWSLVRSASVAVMGQQLQWMFAYPRFLFQVYAPDLHTSICKQHQGHSSSRPRSQIHVQLAPTCLDTQKTTVLPRCIWGSKLVALFNMLKWHECIE
jgi:hypothetical protein